LTPIADMIEQMLSENAPPAAILAAVRAMERVTAVTRDKALQSRVTKRDGNNKRQQARRERLKLQTLTTEAQANDGATVGVTVTRDSVTPPCDLLSSSINREALSKEVKKTRKQEGTENARATRMQPGALLTEPFREAALAIGARPEDIPGAWAEFVDYWIAVPGSRGLKLDWPATWRNRVRDVLKRGKPRENSNGRRTVHDAARDLAARVQALDEPAPELCDDTGRSPLRLLPAR
jgi:hypothetical protein